MTRVPAHVRRLDIRLSNDDWQALDQAFEQTEGGQNYEEFCARLLLDGLTLAYRGGLAKPPAGKRGAA